MFTQETFAKTIDALRKQHDKDTSYANSIERLINAENVPAYDNSALTNHIFWMLQNQFPSSNGECEIERFCYDLNFGFWEGRQVLTADDLWEALHKRKSLPELNDVAEQQK